MSLADLYNQLVETDEEIEKEAAFEAVQEFADDGGYEDDAVKMAAEYDAAGRILARGFFSEMLKEAAEAEEGEEDEEEKKKKKKEEEGEGVPAGLRAMMAEKKAAYLEAMQNDPEYAAQLIAHFTETE